MMRTVRLTILFNFGGREIQSKQSIVIVIWNTAGV